MLTKYGIFLKNLNLYQMTNEAKQELNNHITFHFNCYTSNIIDRHDFTNAIEEYIETL